MSIYNVGGGGAKSADKIDYDNTDSGLEATNVQDGIDELNSNLGDLSNIETSTLNSVAKLLQYWIDKGELSNPNLVPLVPIMTSDTTPYGKVTASGTWETHYPYYVFDNNISTEWWSQNTNTIRWIAYKFVNNCKVKALKFICGSTNSASSITIQGSNDGNTWNDIATKPISGWTNNKEINVTFTNNSYYSNYRVVFGGITNPTSSIAIRTLQFYEQAE